MSRKLVLVTYDVCDSRRLAAAREAVSGWAHGGQRSVFECLAHPAERGTLSADMRAPLLLCEDRLALFAVRGSGAEALGLGLISADAPVVWVG